jgi:chaperonin cofactor prefoldin
MEPEELQNKIGELEERLDALYLRFETLQKQVLRIAELMSDISEAVFLNEIAEERKN